MEIVAVAVAADIVALMALEQFLVDLAQFEWER